MQKPSYPIPKAPTRHSDISATARWLPASAAPYAQLVRLDRPAGYWLLVLPAWFAILIATPHFEWRTIGLLALFFLGAITLRGAGCVINDFWDRDLDRRVERTVDRPLASGAISSRRALGFFLALLILGVCVLLFLPWRVWVWAGMSVPLIIIYPLAKRFLPTPQAVLALTFSWGAILGWLSVQTTLHPSSAFLYLGVFTWILYYDTIYACQDLADDRKMGLYSMPLFLDGHLKLGLKIFAVCTLVFWGFAIMLADATAVFSWIGLGIVAVYFARQLQKFDARSPTVCLSQFKQNVRIGQIWCLFLALSLIF